MGHPRPRPKRLAEKLLKIRQALGVSQSVMVHRLGVELAPSSISKYEHNLNEPPTDVILAYARLARVPLEQLVDDELELRFECILKEISTPESGAASNPR